MREFNNLIFTEIIDQINNPSVTIINTMLPNGDIPKLKYFLTRNYYYAVIVDDYLFDISNKEELLEAIYYQARLINVYDLNWDAVQEGLDNLLATFSDFKGMCLLFKKGNYIKHKLPNEFDVLTKLLSEINDEQNIKKIKLIMNTGP
jgi:hypothetical protein